jgi:hypothetical protein
MLMSGVIMLQDGACLRVTNTVQDMLCFMCWMLDCPLLSGPFATWLQVCGGAVFPAAPHGVLGWEDLLADIHTELLPQCLWGLFSAASFAMNDP